MVERSVRRDDEIVKIVYSREIERVLIQLKKSNRALFNKLTYQIEKIIREPQFGKPLRYTLKNRRRIHMSSFVLVYEFHNGELRFVDFDHHDRIYKNYG